MAVTQDILPESGSMMCESDAVKASTSTAKKNAQSAYTKNISSLFHNPKYSDLVLRCGGRDVKVHRAIVCPQCPFFAAPWDHGFKESQGNSIDMEDDSPEILDAFLQFLYTCDYADDRYFVAEPSASMVLTFHAKVHAMADKYNVLPLKSLACSKFLERSSTLQYADFFAAVGVIYSTTSESDNALRDVAVTLATRHGQRLLRCPGGLEALKENPSFAAEVVMAGIAGVSGSTRDLYSSLKPCPACKSERVGTALPLDTWKWNCFDCGSLFKMLAAR